MSASPPSCLRCQAVMEPGYVVDYTHAGMRQSTWVEGEPQPAFWTGLSVRGRLQLPVTTFRCPDCGYLESYAPEG